MDYYGLFVHFIADYIVLIIILVAVIALLVTIPKGERRRAYARILMAGLTSLLIAKFISVTWHPEVARPYILMGIDPGASAVGNDGFPSDHSLFVAAVALAVWAETRRKWIAISLAIMAALVLLGRVLAFVHTPLDVVVGALLGLVGGIWYLQRDKSNRPTRVDKA